MNEDEGGRAGVRRWSTGKGTAGRAKGARESVKAATLGHRFTGPRAVLRAHKVPLALCRGAPRSAPTRSLHDERCEARERARDAYKHVILSRGQPHYSKLYNALISQDANASSDFPDGPQIKHFTAKFYHFFRMA